MMEEAERILREAGCPKISLQIRSSNSKVIAFYEGLGFREDRVTSLGKRLEVDEPYPVELAVHTQSQSRPTLET